MWARWVVVGSLLLVGVAPRTDSVGRTDRSWSGRGVVSAPQTALVWPGGGRMLAAPLVVGASVVGDGALEMVGDTITPVGGNAPQELSLRVFTLVANKTGGLSAILRFRTPVVWLHSWRNHAVRQTMTVLVSAPSGAVDAVQLQPDGSAVTGTMVSGGFVPSGPGRAIVAGNDSVFDLPASMGVKPDWTVQAIVEVQADEPLHKNRPATGYAAGTSVVPVGLLTGRRPHRRVGPWPMPSPR